MNDFAIVGVYISEKGMYPAHVEFYSKLVQKIAEAENMTVEEFWGIARDMLESMITQIDEDVLEVQGDEQD